eukprot:14032798-Alexandrium_andersonii.AAC.1
MLHAAETQAAWRPWPGNPGSWLRALRAAARRARRSQPWASLAQGQDLWSRAWGQAASKTTFDHVDHERTGARH